MTNLELQLRFEQRFRNHINKDLDIRTIDIEFYLNEGLDKFIEEWYKIFEYNESARKRLNPLVKYAILDTSTNGSHPRGRYFNLTENYRYILQEEAQVSYNDCHGSPQTIRSSVKPVKLDYYNRHIHNPFKKPYRDLVWRLDIGNTDKRHELIYGDDVTNITHYYLTYLANPIKITLLTGTPETSNIEISEEFHEEVIDEAIKVALKTFELNNITHPQTK